MADLLESIRESVFGRDQHGPPVYNLTGQRNVLTSLVPNMDTIRQLALIPFGLKVVLEVC